MAPVGAEVVRVTDNAILKAPMETLREAIPARGGVQGSGSVYLIENHADTALMSLRYALKGADIAVAEKPFEAAGRHFGAGAWIVRKADGDAFSKKLSELGLDAWAVAAAPDVAAHKIGAPCSTYMGSMPGFCDGVGACAECTQDSECPGATTDCSMSSPCHCRLARFHTRWPQTQTG